MMLRNEEGKGRISLDDSDGIKHVASVMSQGREGNCWCGIFIGG